MVVRRRSGLVSFSDRFRGPERAAQQGVHGEQGFGFAGCLLAHLAVGKRRTASQYSGNHLAGDRADGGCQCWTGLVEAARVGAVPQIALALAAGFRGSCAAALYHLPAHPQRQSRSLASLQGRGKAYQPGLSECRAPEHDLSALRSLACRRLYQLLLLWLCACGHTHQTAGDCAPCRVQSGAPDALLAYRNGRDVHLI